MSRADVHADNGTRPDDQASAERAAPRARQARDPWHRAEAGEAVTVPAAGQPGHGRAASLRRQPARIVLGRMDGGYTGAFEVICCDCGDRPFWDYSEIPFQLQRIRGPYPLDAGIGAYEQHLGLAT